MAFVTIDKSYLDNIANAIREKNNTSRVYRPKDMAAAVLALEYVTETGTVVEDSPASGTILSIDESYLRAIATAIRDQADSETTFRPKDMPAAIRALVFAPIEIATITGTTDGCDTHEHYQLQFNDDCKTAPAYSLSVDAFGKYINIIRAGDKGTGPRVMENYLFEGQTCLRYINIPAGTTTIGRYAFSGIPYPECALISIIINGNQTLSDFGYTNIEDSPFSFFADTGSSIPFMIYVHDSVYDSWVMSVATEENRHRIMRIEDNPDIANYM